MDKSTTLEQWDGDFEDTLRWHMVFQLLSLERTGEFLKYISLPIKLEEFEILMRIAKEFEDGYNQNFVKSQQIQSTSHKDQFEIMVDLIRKALNKIIDTLGYDRAINFINWVGKDFPYPPSKSVSQDGWMTMFYRLADSAVGETLVSCSLRQEEVNLLRQSMLKYKESKDSLSNEISDYNQPSEWEIKLMNIWGGKIPAIDYIEIFAKRHLFKRLLEELRAGLGNNGMTALVNWSKAEAEILGMPPFLFADLDYEFEQK
jgi:hypothetical protein